MILVSRSHVHVDLYTVICGAFWTSTISWNPLQPLYYGHPQFYALIELLGIELLSVNSVFTHALHLFLVLLKYEPAATYAFAKWYRVKYWNNDFCFFQLFGPSETKKTTTIRSWQWPIVDHTHLSNKPHALFVYC